MAKKADGGGPSPSRMKNIEIQIKGLTALLQNRFNEQAQSSPSTRPALVQNLEPRAQAELAANRNGQGFFFPGAAIARMLREAGGAHKMRGSRKSVKYLVPAAVIMGNDEIIILNGDGKTKAENFEVDSRPVTIPATKGRIMRHRPRFDAWSAKFSLMIDEEVLPVDLVHQLLTEGGMRIGIGDYRPEKGGPFGRFQVVRWKEK